MTPRCLGGGGMLALQLRPWPLGWLLEIACPAHAHPFLLTFLALQALSPCSQVPLGAPARSMEVVQKCLWTAEPLSWKFQLPTKMLL